LTPAEIENMKQRVESDDHQHMSPLALALHAQRIGKALASPSTWYRLVKNAGWRRPRIRVHPDKSKIGIRAKAPGELHHLDVTIIGLLDGNRAYLHAVIDNYSRRILSWRLEERLGSGDEVDKKLAEAHKTARKKRMDANRAAECGVCVGETSSGALLLQRSRSRMS
jgi:putative transposase